MQNEKFAEILDNYKDDVASFAQGDEMSKTLYDTLYDYYVCEMPYGTAKARTGDPYQWINDRFGRDILRYFFSNN